MLRENFDQWVTAHYDELIAVARRLVNNPEDAAEAVHEAVAQTLANGRLESIENPWTWTVNAVRGTAANFRRAEKRQAALRAGLYHPTQKGSE